MVTEVLEKVLIEALDAYILETVKVVKSNRPDLCDYQFDGAFQLAKLYKKSPMEIAEEISCVLRESSYFKKVEAVTPGFINMTLSDSFMNQILRDMKKFPKFNLPQVEPTLTYVIDYGGPNIAKPLHVGHLRPAIVGESIKRIIAYVGHKVIGDVHFGDFGLQIGEVIYGMQKEHISVEDVTLEDLNRLYPEISALCKEDEVVKETCENITKELQDGSLEYERYYRKIFDLSKKDIVRIYKYLDVDFDLWYGEMDSRAFIPLVEKILVEKSLAYISEGALVVDVTEETDKKEIPPLIFKKRNNGYLYGSTDMATIYQREKDFHPDYILYVADLRQSLHFNQVFRASLKAGITDAQLEHIGFGTINGNDGKPYKTRSGKTPKLDALFKEVEELFVESKETNKDMSEEDKKRIVNSILKFADLQNNREKDYIFDGKKFSDVVGKTGPYVLYTYLRIKRILELEEYKENGLSDTIYNEYDRNLRLQLLDFHKDVLGAFHLRLPSVIASYIYDLCVCLNTFYQNNHVSKLEDETKKQDWLFVLALAKDVLKELLNLLGIEIPSMM
jgi:arginyl-tRNA synthetase